MKNINLYFMNSVFIAIVTYCTVLPARGSPVGITPRSKAENLSTVPQTPNSLFNSSYAGDYIYVENTTSKLRCNATEYGLEDVIIFENGDIILKDKNFTVYSFGYLMTNGTISVCQFITNCAQKFEYEKGEYQILINNSAIVDNETFMEGEYELDDDVLLICDTGVNTSSVLTLKDYSIHVGQVGSAISVIALAVHLLTYIFLPTLRNLPGCNLASLAVAFLLAYSFFLIGQIPQVRGTFCVVSAVLEHNFFLAAFFCMNILAFDVWMMLKRTTQKFEVRSQITKKRQFIWYSLYAWGVPLVITSISVVIDNVDGVPSSIKPYYGKNNICFMNNNLPKAVFFAVPVFVLILVNAVLFLMSWWVISSNEMKVSVDHNKHTMKLNYVLYVRLAIMMGLTWLVGLIGMVSGNGVVWFIFDFVNSLQGLYLFLLFTCTKKVFKQFVEKSKAIKLSTIKQTTLTTSSS